MSIAFDRELLKPKRVLSKIRRKGFFRVVRVGFSVIVDAFYDKFTGASTSKLVPPSEIDTTSENKTHGNCYQPSKARPLRWLLRSFPLPLNKTFVDYGCGKGRVLLIAAEYGFKHVVGIEYSKSLCDEARKNVQQFQQRKNLDSKMEVIEADATVHPVLPDTAVFFMFNPFNELIMAKVLHQMKMSFETHPRESWLIYNAPVHHDVVAQSGAFHSWTQKEHWGNQFMVYHRQAQ